MEDDEQVSSDASFAALLIRHRRMAGLTQEELAVRAGLSVRAISNIERVRSRGPRQRSVEALASALELGEADRTSFLDAARRGRRERDRRMRVDPDFSSLPPALNGLTGRETELTRLTELAEAAASVPWSPVATISGLPGVGKTSLALTAANLIASRYPDGPIFVDLRGTDPHPMDPADGLRRLLRVLDTDRSGLPESVDEGADLLWSRLRGKRALIVLDNAADEAQVRPLLPVEGGCFVLITSRRALAGLDTDCRVLLDVLQPSSSLTVLGGIVGTERIRAEPQAAKEVVELCGYLPLALRIAGNRLAVRPQWTIEYLADQLRDQRYQLTTLSAGDVRVRAAFALSYQQLDPMTRLVFRRLSLVPGADFSVSLVAVLAKIDRSSAEEAADRLLEASLLQPAATAGRYRFHDLIRTFAAEVFAEDEPAAEREAVADEMASWLVAVASKASLFFDPDRQPADPLDHALVTSSAEAAAWLDAEVGNWFPSVRRLAAAGQHDAVIGIARAMHWYSDVRTHPHPWDELFQLGVHAARAVGSKQDECVLLNFLGWALFFCRREHREGLNTHYSALVAAREIGNRREQAWALRHIATILIELGFPQQAIDFCHRAIAGFEAAGYPLGTMISRYHLGNALWAAGHFADALDMHRQVVGEMKREHRGVPVELASRFVALARESIAGDLAGLNRWQEALTAYREASDRLRAAGSRWSLGRARYGQALAHRRLGEVTASIECLHEAHAIFDEVRDPVWQFHCLQSMAEIGAS